MDYRLTDWTIISLRIRTELSNEFPVQPVSGSIRQTIALYRHLEI
tara:strand:- start:3581 stop:3715 length:135 start_codon:yes stop_codon:yes gene_type:complete